MDIERSLDIEVTLGGFIRGITSATDDFIAEFGIPLDIVIDVYQRISGAVFRVNGSDRVRFESEMRVFWSQRGVTLSVRELIESAA
jgi:hypothetical protein